MLEWLSLMVDNELLLHAKTCLHSKLVFAHQAYSMGSHNNVGKQDLIHLGLGHDRWPRKLFLKLLEGQDTLLGALESLPLI